MLFLPSLSANKEILLLPHPSSTDSSMRLIRDGFFVIFAGTLFVCSTGCSSNEATVAPRTEEEIAAYKEDVYAAEEEDDAEAEE